MSQNFSSPMWTFKNKSWTLKRKKKNHPHMEILVFCWWQMKPVENDSIFLSISLISFVILAICLYIYLFILFFSLSNYLLVPKRQWGPTLDSKPFWRLYSCLSVCMRRDSIRRNYPISLKVLHRSISMHYVQWSKIL